MSNRPTILAQAADLAEGTRCRLLQLLDDHELSVNELCAVLQSPQSTVSRHLKVLAEGGWVSPRREGTRNVYQRSDMLDDGATRLWQLIRDQISSSADSQQDRRRLAAVLRERRSRSQEFFSTATADDWDRLRDDLFGRVFDLHALLGLLDPAWRVGDLGCGTGRISETLAPFVTEVIAVDGSAAMLDAANARLGRFDNVEVRSGDLERLPLPDGDIDGGLDNSGLDVVTLFLTLHHQTQPARVLAEARRVLKPGGRLLVVDMLPHEHEEFRQQMGHVWLGFSAEQIEREMVEAGIGAPRVVALPPDPEARGPELFVASGIVAKTPTADTPIRRSVKQPPVKQTLASTREVVRSGDAR